MNDIWKFQNSHTWKFKTNLISVTNTSDLHLIPEDFFKKRIALKNCVKIIRKYFWSHYVEFCINIEKNLLYFYTLSFLKWLENENDDFTRCNTVQKNAPFQFLNSCYSNIFHLHGLRYWERAVLIWILSLKVRF